MKEENLSKECRNIIEEIRAIESVKINQRITREIEDARNERELVWDLYNTIILLGDNINSIEENLKLLKHKLI